MIAPIRQQMTSAKDLNIEHSGLALIAVKENRGVIAGNITVITNASNVVDNK